MSQYDVQEILTRAFRPDSIGVKVQSFSRDKTKASLILFLSHVDVARRLDEADPEWSFSIMSTERQDLHDRDGKITGQLICICASLSIRGVVRQNYGEGEDFKSAASDALKRCAMLFGVGRALYDADIVWVPYDESRDKFRSWTYEDYKAALRGKKEPEAVETTAPAPDRQSPHGHDSAGPAANFHPIFAGVAPAPGPAPVAQPKTPRITPKPLPTAAEGVPGVSKGKKSVRQTRLLAAAGLNRWPIEQVKEYIELRWQPGQLVDDLAESDFNDLIRVVREYSSQDALSDIREIK